MINLIADKIEKFIFVFILSELKTSNLLECKNNLYFTEASN